VREKLRVDAHFFALGLQRCTALFRSQDNQAEELLHTKTPMADRKVRGGRVNVLLPGVPDAPASLELAEAWRV
jgi:hypothetical protein